MTQLLARVARYGEWWAVEYELGGETYHTQASNYSQISEMVVDSAALISDRPESDFSVRIVLADERYAALVAEYKAASLALDNAEDNVKRASRDAVRTFRSDGLKVREIASLMGLTAARVSQLARTAELPAV